MYLQLSRSVAACTALASFGESMQWSYCKVCLGIAAMVADGLSSQLRTQVSSTAAVALPRMPQHLKHLRHEGTCSLILSWKFLPSSCERSRKLTSVIAALAAPSSPLLHSVHSP